MIIKVKITANSRKNEIVGWQSNVLKIKIAATPQKGKANKVLTSFLAKEWNIAKNNIKIVRGERSRLKVLDISGINTLPSPGNYPATESYSYKSTRL